MTKPEALKRVVVTEDPTQDEAAVIFVDATSGADIAHLTINPTLVGADALSGYQIRAAVAAALEPFRRYNRAITGKYGTYSDEQHLFDVAVAQASDELEQLVHLAPEPEAEQVAAPTPDATPSEPQPAAAEPAPAPVEPTGGDAPAPADDAQSALPSEA